MNYQILILAILITIQSITSQADLKWGEREENEVVVLTSSNFNEFINQHTFVFVKFYAPWCGHCKNLAPKFTNLARMMKSRENGMPLAQVDASVETELSQRFGIKGYPTLKLFIDGQPIYYKGARDEQAMDQWLSQKMRSPTRRISNKEELFELQQKKIGVLLITQENNKEQIRQFEALSRGFDMIPFSFSFSEEVAQHLEVDSGLNHLILFRQFDDGNKTLVNKELLNFDEMFRFLEIHRFPLVMEFNSDTAERIFQNQKTCLFVLTDEKEIPEIQIFKELAQAQGHDILFCQSTISFGLGQRLAEFLSVSKMEKPQVRLIKFEGNDIRKFKFKSELTKEQLKLFIEEFKAGQLKPYKKSQQIPQENNGPAKIIVSDSFDDFVLDSDKYVLLNICQANNSNCVKFDLVYNQLAEQLKINNDLIVGKIDASENEHELIKVKGYPTLRFFKKGDKYHPIDYKGEHSLDEMIKFLENNMGRRLVNREPTISSEEEL